MALYFKHCFFTDPERWGVLGLPKRQGPKSIKERFNPPGLVLLALTVSAKSRLAGSIFAACTVEREPVPTRSNLNPELERQLADRWPWCLVINRLWKLHPKLYLDVAGGQLAETAERERGKLFRLPQNTEAEIERWLEQQKLQEIKVYRSA